MSRRGSYLSRSITRNISRHTPLVTSDPSAADLAATVFDVTYRYVGGTSRSFPVLALDRDHAEVLAEMRLIDTRSVVIPATTITPRTETSRSGIQTVRAIESRAEAEDRQGRYAEREAGSRRFPQSLPNDTEPERARSERSDG